MFHPVWPLNQQLFVGKLLDLQMKKLQKLLHPSEMKLSECIWQCEAELNRCCGRARCGWLTKQSVRWWRTGVQWRTVRWRRWVELWGHLVDRGGTTTVRWRFETDSFAQTFVFDWILSQHLCEFTCWRASTWWPSADWKIYLKHALSIFFFF